MIGGSESRGAIVDALKVIELNSYLGRPVSLSDLRNLLTRDLTDEEINHLLTNPAVAYKLYRDELYMIHCRKKHLLDDVLSMKRWSALKLAYAQRLAQLLRGLGTMFAAVCGSVAYGLSAKEDDIDLFVATLPNKTWIFLFKAYLITRVERIRARIRGREASYCFSIVLDWNRLLDIYGRSGNPLVARDILASIPLIGDENFNEFLREARWIRDFYPTLYDKKMDGKAIKRVPNHVVDQESFPTKLLNVVIFALLSTYLKILAKVRNVRFRKRRMYDRLFKIITDPHMLLLSSIKYYKLERWYRGWA